MKFLALFNILSTSANGLPASLTSSELDWGAKDSMVLSATAYCKQLVEQPSSTARSNFTCGWKCDRLRNLGLEYRESVYHVESESAAFIASHAPSNSIFLAFRGTTFNSTNFANIASDLKLDKIALPDFSKANLTDDDQIKMKETEKQGTQVHRGFAEAYLFLRPKLQASLLPLLSSSHPQTKLYITGHSLGGSLAELSAIDFLTPSSPFYLSNQSQLFLTTFGQPRNGNEEYAIHASKLLSSSSRSRATVQRVALVDDPVPYLPLQVFNYIHATPQFNLSGESIYPCPHSGPAGESESCLSASPLALSPNMHLTGYFNITASFTDC